MPKSALSRSFTGTARSVVRLSEPSEDPEPGSTKSHVDRSGEAGSEIDRNRQLVLAGWAGSRVRMTEAGRARECDALPAPGAGALQEVERVFLGPAPAGRQEAYPERSQGPRRVGRYQCDEGSDDQPRGQCYRRSPRPPPHTSPLDSSVSEDVVESEDRDARRYRNSGGRGLVWQLRRPGHGHPRPSEKSRSRFPASSRVSSRLQNAKRTRDRPSSGGE